MMAPSDETLREILTRTRVIACVGMSPNEMRPSHRVARYLIERGYRVIPVNPGHAGRTILGQTVMRNIRYVPQDIDMVDIFRRSNQVLPVVSAALEVLPNLRTIWMQIGVVNEAAAAMARARGVDVVQDRCPKIEYERLMRRGG